MKQQILNLKKKLLIVELPEGASNIRAYNGSIHYDILINTEAPTNLLAKVKNLIGKLTDITEEQFKEWVESFGQNGYMNYLSGSQYSELLKSTAKESFFSYLEKEGIYFSNPLGKKPSEIDIMRASWFDNPITDEDRKVWAWQEAEEKVWNKNNCYIFEII